MIRFFIPACLLLFTLNFGAFSILEAVPKDLSEETDTKRKRKKKNRQERDTRPTDPSIAQELKELPSKRNIPQIEADKNFRMTVDQIKSASLWIDRTVGNRLIKSGVQPNKQTDDFVFVRRIYLDVAGRIPTDGEASSFLTNKDPEKRRKLIDQLLLSDGYRSHLFNWMADLLRHRGKLRRSNFNHYERWLKDQIAQNIRWDEVVYKMLTAEGTLASSGPVSYTHLRAHET